MNHSNSSLDTMTSNKINRRSLRKKGRIELQNLDNRKSQWNKLYGNKTASIIHAPEKNTEKPLVSSIPQPGQPSQPILMVEVINVTHEKFKQTEEIKVIYKMILKNVRNIVKIVPFSYFV